MNLPTEGTRLCLSVRIGTVKFVGQVEGTSGTWIGVEWDDPHRGKHNGTKDGKTYFTTRHPTAGSFIRPSANINYGTDFIHALTSKYIELPHGSQAPEQVILGSSNGAIVVEAVGLDKIRGKLSNLARLREVSLDSELVARSNSPGTIQATCPNIRGLDLSGSLIPTWDVVASISKELPSLERLALNRNRFRPPADALLMNTAFTKLMELHLNNTGITWPEIQVVIASMPKLRSLEIGYNRLTRLAGSTDPSEEDHAGIRSINFDSNALTDWTGLWYSLRSYKSLQRVILTSNCIDTISFPADAEQRFSSLTQLFLSSNRLNSWEDIDALAAWCPSIETLAIFGNSVIDREIAHSRPLIIAKVPSLITLDGAIITPREREDAELFYQSYIVRQGPESEEQRVKAHPQWQRLCDKHGRPESHIQPSNASTEKLSHRLIEVKVYLAATPSQDAFGSIVTDSKPLTVQILCTMKLKLLRLKIAKTTKRARSKVTIWLKQRDHYALLSDDDDNKDMEWMGIGNDAVLVVYIDV